jgi:hypothetical protein
MEQWQFRGKPIKWTRMVVESFEQKKQSEKQNRSFSGFEELTISEFDRTWKVVFATGCFQEMRESRRSVESKVNGRSGQIEGKGDFLSGTARSWFFPNDTTFKSNHRPYKKSPRLLLNDPLVEIKSRYEGGRVRTVFTFFRPDKTFLDSGSDGFGISFGCCQTKPGVTTLPGSAGNATVVKLHPTDPVFVSIAEVYACIIWNPGVDIAMIPPPGARMPAFLGERETMAGARALAEEEPPFTLTIKMSDVEAPAEISQAPAVRPSIPAFYGAPNVRRPGSRDSKKQSSVVDDGHMVRSRRLPKNRTRPTGAHDTCVCFAAGREVDDRLANKCSGNLDAPAEGIAFPSEYAELFRGRHCH